MADPLAPFRLAGHRVDPSLNRITAPSGETVQVEPKIMQVLVVLAERAGDVVSRDDLMARVWNGVFVTDDALHRAIRELRRLFGDDAERPRVIETIRKRGYRLIAAVEPSTAPSPTAAVPAAVVHRPQTDWMPGPLALVGLLAASIVGGAALVSLGIVRRAPPLIAPARFMPYTSEPGNEVDPALSPSGRLAYVARGSDGRPHLFAKATPEATAVQITNGDATERAPAWSPDESQIAFVRMDGGGCAIWIAAADGRNGRTLLPCLAVDEFRMSWSPDGQRLAVSAGAGNARSPGHIEVVSVADAQHRVLTDPPPGQSGDWSPAFSPDGREIAFVRTISGSVADVYVVPSAGGRPRRVTTDNADVLGVDWDPDSRHLVFSSERAGGIGLWRIDASERDDTHGSAPTLLAGGGAKLKHPSVARRTGAVAYEEWQYEINLRERPVDPQPPGAGERPIAATADRWNFHPQLSPDGRRLVFQSTRSGQYELWLSDPDGGGARPLTRSGVYKSLARWSPDGRRLAFTMRTDDGFALMTLDVDGGEARTLATAASGLVAPRWSHDGAAIYAAFLQGDWQIWRIDAATGARRQVTSDGGYAAMESSNGRWLYVARLDRPGLWRRPIDGGPEALTAERVRAEQWPNWGISARGIYYLTWPDDNDPQLAIIEHGSTTPQFLTRLAEYAWPGIALTPDGARVLYAHADRRTANIGGLQLAR